MKSLAVRPVCKREASAASSTTFNASYSGTQVGYTGYFDVTISTTTVTNSNWKIVNGTMTIAVDPAFGYGGWTTVVTFTQKAPVVSGTPTSLTGTVTNNNPYTGTATTSYSAPSPYAVPFDAGHHTYGTNSNEPNVYAGSAAWSSAYNAFYYLAYGAPGVVGTWYAPAYGDLFGY
jgi:hypothetical protein